MERTGNVDRKTYFNGLIFLFILFILMPSGALAEEKVPQPARIQQLITDHGQAPVIVMLNVDNYKSLAQASAEYIPGRQSDPTTGTPVDPDQILADTIAAVANQVTSTLSNGTFKVKRVFKVTPAMALTVDQTALESLQQNPLVLSIQENTLSEAFPLDTKPSSGSIDEPFLNDSTPLIGADTAWSMGYTGAGVYVAVLDTGVKTNHEMFTGKTFVEACYGTTDSTYQSSPVCPNGQESQTGPGAAAPNAGAHGTHVSGIAAGNNTNYQSGEPQKGVAPGANIIAVQVFSKFDSESVCGAGQAPCYLSWNTDQIAGLEFVYGKRSEYTIASVNMSLGGGAYDAYCDSDSRKTIIDQLKTAKIATAIATGNNGYCEATGAPGCISSAVSIGASSKSDVEATFNNWHPTIQDLFAPGVSILSATSTSTTSYESWDGTSMATPHVAGAFAVLKQANPTASVDTLEAALKQTGTNITTLCGTGVSKPRINVDKALEKVIPTPTPEKPIVAPVNSLLLN